jgi:hypothetical protein
MSDIRSIDCHKQELDKLKLICAELQAEHLRKDEIILNLVAKLKASSPFNTQHSDADVLLKEIPRKRAEAHECYQIEHGIRVGHVFPNVASYSSNEGFDEIDS